MNMPNRFAQNVSCSGICTFPFSESAPNTRPAFSPYLNIVRPGGSTAFNYYGLVRPEVAARNAIGTLQTDVDANRQLITTGTGGAAGAGPLQTGHAAGFLNNGGYFLNATGGAGAVRGGAAPPARPGGQGVAAAGATPKKGK